MPELEGLWTIETAAAWLLQHVRGERFVTLLAEDTHPDRQARWLRMVVGMHSAIYGPTVSTINRAPTAGKSSDVERASAWLHQYPFGATLTRHLEADPRPERIEHFLEAVSNMQTNRRFSPLIRGVTKSKQKLCAD